MSHISKYYILQVLQEVCEVLSDVSDNVFPTQRPSAKQEQMQDFVVVSFPNRIVDENAFQRTTMQIELFARTKANGVANVGRLQKMLDAVAEHFPIVAERYSITNPQVRISGADSLGFTVWNIQAKMIINTTDSYQY